MTMLDFNKNYKGVIINKNDNRKNCNNTKKGTTDPEIISGIIENVIPIAVDASIKIISMIFNKRKE